MENQRRKSARQEGSIYIIALMVLLIMTIIGLSLSLTTQSELRIGANERLATMVFYAANSGVDIATAKALVTNDKNSFRLHLVQPSNVPNLNIRHRLDVSPFLPILDSPCNLCQVNQGEEFLRINHAVASAASRIAWVGGVDPDTSGPPAGIDPSPLALKRLSLLISIQPTRVDTRGAVRAITDPNRGTMKNAF